MSIYYNRIIKINSIKNRKGGHENASKTFI